MLEVLKSRLQIFKRSKVEREFVVLEADKDLQELLYDFVMDHDCNSHPSGLRYYTVTIEQGSPIWRALDLHPQKEKTYADI